MRGKGSNRPAYLCKNRITPAYAGKSANVPAGFWCFRDHPRVCGEKFATMFENMFMVGSPPRMRGKADECFFILLHDGITPAYAGKSYHPRHMVIIIGDHPRVCGEKGLSRLWTRSTRGSPPRMRGKVYDRFSDYVALGITPAYAGKSALRPDTVQGF